MFDPKIWFISLLFFRLTFLSTAAKPPSHVPAPSHHFHTASQQFTRLSTVPLPMITNRFRFHVWCLSRFSNYLIVAFVILSGDIELNPGPSAPFLHMHTFISDPYSTVHILLFCLILLTHISLTYSVLLKHATPAELVDCTAPGYTLISHPRTIAFRNVRTLVVAPPSLSENLSV